MAEVSMMSNNFVNKVKEGERQVQCCTALSFTKLVTPMVTPIPRVCWTWLQRTSKF